MGAQFPTLFRRMYIGIWSLGPDEIPLTCTATMSDISITRSPLHRATWKTHTPTDGLAGLDLQQVAQDRDGFIWIEDGEPDRKLALWSAETFKELNPDADFETYGPAAGLLLLVGQAESVNTPYGPTAPFTWANGGVQIRSK